MWSGAGKVHADRHRRRICIVGGGSISQNPRVVKEANALAATGRDVVVLFLQHHRWERSFDRQIVRNADWHAEVVDLSPSPLGRLRRWISAVQTRIFRRVCRWTLHTPFAELAYSRCLLGLTWRAIRHRSDLYIAHYPGGLPVVSWAAWWTGAKFGFDFEDFYRANRVDDGVTRFTMELVKTLEDRYLPKASIMTAASWGIAAEVARTTGLPEPLTILNVFPWNDRTQLAAPALAPQSSPLSLYWFSQIISLDRGLQDVVVAMGLMHQSVVLHVRGTDSAGSIGALRNLATDHGVSQNVHFHPAVSPGELLSDASRHDVGLCLENPRSLNRDICITNKIFLYMLAGLAIVASRTRGQRMVLDAAPGIGFDYEPGDAHALAEILDRYAADRDLLKRTKTNALQAAQKRWNWERESEALVAAIGALA